MGEVWEQADLPPGDPQTPREPTVGRDRSAAGSTPGNNINYIRPVPNTIYYISYLQWQGEVAKGEPRRGSREGEAVKGIPGRGGRANRVARDPGGRGKVVPTGPPPRRRCFDGGEGPRRWGRRVVAELDLGKAFSHG